MKQKHTRLSHILNEYDKARTSYTFPIECFIVTTKREQNTTARTISSLLLGFDPV